MAKNQKNQTTPATGAASPAVTVGASAAVGASPVKPKPSEAAVGASPVKAGAAVVEVEKLKVKPWQWKEITNPNLSLIHI